MCPGTQGGGGWGGCIPVVSVCVYVCMDIYVGLTDEYMMQTLTLKSLCTLWCVCLLCLSSVGVHVYILCVNRSRLGIHVYILCVCACPGVGCIEVR